MRRLKLTIEYEGTPFAGWQVQEGRPTVQGILQDQFESFLGAPTSVQGSGRTDAGVHARGQVAHVNLSKPYSAFEVQGAMNKRLQDFPIVLVNVEEVPSDFHARFSARMRAYTYTILNRRPPPALERNRVWWVAPPLNVEAMKEAAQYLVGHHDFSSFRDSQCQASSPIKTLHSVEVDPQGERILITVKARSFLHHQVRNMVGTLKLVGREKVPPTGIRDILEAKDRKAAGPTAPSCGLCLTEILYEDLP